MKIFYTFGIKLWFQLLNSVKRTYLMNRTKTCCRSPTSILRCSYVPDDSLASLYSEVTDFCNCKTFTSGIYGKIQLAYLGGKRPQGLLEIHKSHIPFCIPQTAHVDCFLPNKLAVSFLIFLKIQPCAFSKNQISYYVSSDYFLTSLYCPSLSLMQLSARLNYTVNHFLVELTLFLSILHETAL